nr:hypothetical protein B0A51_08849 [Rachicladosporium sp. CCFEE 5018]
MVNAQGLEVYLARKRDLDHRYPEHAIPTTSRQYTSDPKDGFAEVLTDDHFAVVVEFGSGFDFEDCPAVQFTYHIDGDCLTSLYTVAQLEHKAQKMAIPLLRGYSVRDGVRKIVGNEWVEYDFAFSELVMDEDIDLCHEQIDMQLETFGKIVVEIQRGSIKMGNAKKWGSFGEEEIQAKCNVAPVATEIVKNNNVSHAIKHVARKDKEPVLDEWYTPQVFVPSKGAEGKAVKFTFMYRSRDALQRLHVIPRDPSVEPTMPAIEEAVANDPEMPIANITVNPPGDEEVQIIEPRIVDDDIEITQTRPCENPGSGQWKYAASAVKVERGVKRTHAQIEADREALELEEQVEEAKATLKKFQLKQRKAQLEREMENGSGSAPAVKDEDLKIE